MKTMNIMNLIGDFDSCPNCGTSFIGKDIYKHFLDDYTNNWPYQYSKTKDEIKKSIKDFSDLYESRGKIPDIDSMTEIEANAWYSANMYGWTFENPKCFKHTIIGIEVQGYYDGIAFWHCSKCDVYWKRFSWSNFKEAFSECDMIEVNCEKNV